MYELCFGKEKHKEMSPQKKKNSFSFKRQMKFLTTDDKGINNLQY